jgi:DNA-binding NtrC family response regulator
MNRKRLLTDMPQTIVVIDDEEITLEYFKDALSPFCKTCNIKYFSEISDEFFSFIKNNRVDLFIMDVVLGSQNAVKLSEEIVYKRQGSIFLFISGYDYSIDSFSHLKGKCVYDFISKPLKVDVVQTVVATLLNISASYKITFLDQKIEPKEEQVDDMRSKYRKLIEQDKMLIKQFKNGFSDLALNLSSSPKTTYKL